MEMAVADGKDEAFEALQTMHDTIAKHLAAAAAAAAKVVDDSGTDDEDDATVYAVGEDLQADLFETAVETAVETPSGAAEETKNAAPRRRPAAPPKPPTPACTPPRRKSYPDAEEADVEDDDAEAEDEVESAGAAAREAEATEAAEKHASRGRSTAPLSADGANPMARKRPDADAHPAEAEEEADATVRNVETRLPSYYISCESFSQVFDSPPPFHLASSIWQDPEDASLQANAEEDGDNEAPPESEDEVILDAIPER